MHAGRDNGSTDPNSKGGLYPSCSSILAQRKTTGLVLLIQGWEGKTKQKTLLGLPHAPPLPLHCRMPSDGRRWLPHCPVPYLIIACPPLSFQLCTQVFQLKVWIKNERFIVRKFSLV
jgi:hypothetical protein